MAPRSGQVARGSASALVLAVFFTASATACGPIEYVSQVTRKASASVAAAKAVDADKYAPYYYTLAIEYLHKAREEAASADFQAANRFGRKSDEAAQTAKKVAVERAGQPIEKFHPNMDENGDSPDGDSPGGIAPLVESGDSEGEADEDGDESSDTVPADSDADAEDILDEDELPPGLGGDQ